MQRSPENANTLLYYMQRSPENANTPFFSIFNKNYQTYQMTLKICIQYLNSPRNTPCK